jgi:hypothetical protein
MNIDNTRLKVMVPYEVKVSAEILDHRYGKAARLVFDFLLARSAMKYGMDADGFVIVSQVSMQGFGLDTMSRRRGLLALEELGLIQLRQEGQGAYRAKLLYGSPKSDKPNRSARPKLETEDLPIDHEAYLMLQASSANDAQR